MRGRKDWTRKLRCAIYDQYTPASIEDPIPSTVEGQLLGLADRIQTIVAMFGIGNGANWFERSVCASARGERDRENSR